MKTDDHAAEIEYLKYNWMKRFASWKEGSFTFRVAWSSGFVRQMLTKGNEWVTIGNYTAHDAVAIVKMTLRDTLIGAGLGTRTQVGVDQLASVGVCSPSSTPLDDWVPPVTMGPPPNLKPSTRPPSTPPLPYLKTDLVAVATA